VDGIHAEEDQVERRGVFNTVMNLHDTKVLKQLSDCQFLKPDPAGRGLVLNFHAKNVNSVSPDLRNCCRIYLAVIVVLCSCNWAGDVWSCSQHIRVPV
jgi:hypothetical protein